MSQDVRKQPPSDLISINIALRTIIMVGCDEMIVRMVYNVC
jgi:hypothetical protein